MTRLPFLFPLLGIAVLAQADELVLRPSARLLFNEPEIMKPGNCVMYQEGGGSWAEPVYWLKGTVLATDIRSRRLGRCPMVEGKNIDRYTREEYNRLAGAFPCVARNDQVRDEQIGLVRFQVDDWETPWAKRAANTGRLYQGYFLDRPLQKGVELEIEADLLGPCS